MLPAAQIPAFSALSKTIPEPSADINAQVSAMLSPLSTKDAVFVAKGSAAPKDLPPSVHIVTKPEGTILTTNPQKAAIAKDHPWSDQLMAGLLGYPQAKGDAAASGNPIVVQARNPSGNVVSESGVSPDKVPVAMSTLAQHLPGAGDVSTVPLATLLMRRMQAGS